MTAVMSYMGTKHDLALAVSDVLNQARPGMLLDAFSGMGAVGNAVGCGRPLWANDVQFFAYNVGCAVFASAENPPTAFAFATLADSLYEQHFRCLSSELSESLNHERMALTSGTFTGMMDELDLAKAFHVFVSPSTDLSCCFVNSYAWTYFSLHQCVEIDSARHVIDVLYKNGTVGEDVWRWLLIALGRALLKVANTPGHFAQYLRLHERTFSRTQRQKKRSVWSEWLIAISNIHPSGSPEWRSGNRVSRSDSLDLLAMHPDRNDISVVYCDPPYTDDQYSRFYHVLETLILYDYPSTTCMGQYRSDRFTTPFSLKSQVKAAFEKLTSSVASIDADLVLSYPSDGLLHKTGACLESMLSNSFASVKLVYTTQHSHSTFGASKGVAKAIVTENVYLARG